MPTETAVPSAATQAGAVIWVTGFSGAGKSTVAQLLRDRYLAEGVRPIMLDGDAMRAVLGRTQAFTTEERLELAWVYARLCTELSRQGHTVICATISMFDAVRAWTRANAPGYIEVYLRVPFGERETRDPKGHYAKHGVSGAMVGADNAAEEPKQPDLMIDNHGTVTPREAAGKIWEHIVAKHR